MINPIFLTFGLLLLIITTFQDFKTRKPTFIMPSLMFIGLSINLLTGFLIVIYALISLYVLPDEINKVFGKADVFLMASLLTILIIAQNLLINQLIMITCVITIIYWFIYKRQTEQELIPFVGIFCLSFFTTLILNILFYMRLVI